MVATDVRQAELEREARLDRLRENLICEIRDICFIKKLNFVFDRNDIDEDIIYEAKTRCFSIGKNVSRKALNTLFNRLILTEI